jgi:hypothetical protein
MEHILVCTHAGAGAHGFADAEHHQPREELGAERMSSTWMPGRRTFAPPSAVE